VVVSVPVHAVVIVVNDTVAGAVCTGATVVDDEVEVVGRADDDKVVDAIEDEEVLDTIKEDDDLVDEGATEDEEGGETT
jgi:hypothetical protein